MELIERIESSQVLVATGKTGKPSRSQAINIIGLLALLRRGSRVRAPAGSPHSPATPVSLFCIRARSR